MSSRRALAPILALLALLALTHAESVAAAPRRIAIAPIRGDGGGRIGSQLRLALCRAQRCVPGVLIGSRPRLDRARKMGVEAAVFAAIRRERARKELAVRLETVAGRPLGSWRLPLGRDRSIPPEHLSRLADEVEATLRPPSRQAPRANTVPRDPPAPRAIPAPPPPDYTPPPDTSPPATARTSMAAEEREPPDPTIAPVPGEPATPPAEPQVEIVVPRQRPEGVPPRARTEVPLPPPPSALRRTDADPLPPLFTGEVGIDVARRTLEFPAGTSTKPVGYAVNLHVTPRGRVELHPLRYLGPGLAALGVFAEAGYLPASQLSTASQSFKVAYLRLRGGALSRFQVMSGVALTPSLAWEIEQIAIRKPDGERYPGLADSALAGPSLGLDLEVAVASRISLLAAARGIYWLQAGELAGGTSFYPGGNAFGFELEGGLAVRLVGPVSMRVAGCYGVTRWSLEPDPTGAYTVSTAMASSLGGRAWIRLQL